MKNSMSGRDKSLETGELEKIIIYRNKGEERVFKIDATIQGFKIIINDGEKIIDFDNIPNELDITNVPVVVIGGKKGKHQKARLEEFKTNAPDFKGVIFLLPFSWANGRSDGKLLVPNIQILEGKKIKGERITTAMVDPKFLGDGTFVKKYVKMLGDRIIETLNEKEYQIPGSQVLIEALTKEYPSIKTPLVKQIKDTIKTLEDLENQRLFFGTSKKKDIKTLVKGYLAKIFQEKDILSYTDLPENFTVTPEQIYPELVAQKDTLSKVDIPGLGVVPIEEINQKFYWENRTIEENRPIPVVTLTIDELRKVKSWPFNNLGIGIKELGSSPEYQQTRLGKTPIFELLFNTGDIDASQKWEKISNRYRDLWQDYEKSSKRRSSAEAFWTDENLQFTTGKTEFLLYRGANTPVLDERILELTAVVYGHDLLTGEELKLYPAIVKEYHRKGSTWHLKRYDSLDEASSNNELLKNNEIKEKIAADKYSKKLLAEYGKYIENYEVPSFKEFENSISVDTYLKWCGLSEDEYAFLDKDGPFEHIVKEGFSLYSKITEKSTYYDPIYETRWWKYDESKEYEKGKEKILFSKNITTDIVRKLKLSIDGRLDIQEANEQLFIALDKKKLSYFRRTTVPYLESLQRYVHYQLLPHRLKYKVENPDLDETYISLMKDNQEEWDMAASLEQKVSEGEILINYDKNYHVDDCKYTDCRVIGSDGTQRLPDKSDGNHSFWKIVGPEELAVYWSKGSNASEHNFIVDKEPVGGLTEEQKKTIISLEESIESQWKEKRGFSSGIYSPSVDNGRGLTDHVHGDVEYDEKYNAEAEELYKTVPEHITKLFNKEGLVTFIDNVTNLNEHLLDPHELTCGRGRVRSHLEDVSGNEDFFCGADPNDVKYYIRELFFGNEYERPIEEDTNIVDSKTSENSDEEGTTSDNTLQDLLNKYKKH